DAASRFDQAHQALVATRDPQGARQQLASLKAAFEAMRKEGGRDMAPYRAKLEAAERRVAALPLLYGVPLIPRPETTRNPDSSAERAGSDDAARARALMNGYGAEALPAWKRWLYKLMPSLNESEATPAFDRLPAAQKAQFLAVAKAADGAGQLALNGLLVAGRLSPELLGALAGMASAPIDRSVPREALISQALVEVADPVTISQHGRGTCAATSVQILLAHESPAEYVRVLTQLASPAGEAKLPGGAVIRREPDWNAGNDGGRSTPSRLLQPAFMEFANGELDYLNEEDLDLDPATRRKASSGLTAEQAVQLLDGVGLADGGFETQGLLYAADLPDATATGLDETIESARDMLMVLQSGKVIDPKTQDRLMAALERQASPASPVYATVIYTLYPERGDVGFHAVLVTGVKDGQVNYINPWGQEERLSEGRFRTTVLSANLRK
ncbi:MAG: hypothetical protein ACLGIN_16575, partial [Candidatus Sericytochromatia bacterium]